MIIKKKYDSSSLELKGRGISQIWLEEHVGEVINHANARFVDLERQRWLDMVGDYVLMTGDKTPKSLIKIVTGQGWRVACSAPYFEADPFIVYYEIEDELVAVQFRLACL
jgi:hypothetical protein